MAAGVRIKLLQTLRLLRPFSVGPDLFALAFDPAPVRVHFGSLTHDLVLLALLLDALPCLLCLLPPSLLIKLPHSPLDLVTFGVLPDLLAFEFDAPSIGLDPLTLPHHGIRLAITHRILGKRCRWPQQGTT